MQILIELSPVSIESIVAGIAKVSKNLANKAWYEREWVIALSSALLGVIASFLIQGISEWTKTRKYRKQMARDLFMEVHANSSKSLKTQKATNTILCQFRNLVASGVFSSHPNLINTGTETYRVNFEKYLDRMYLLPPILATKIHFFYQLDVRNVEAGMRVIQDRFEKFYDGSDLVSSNDVIQILEEHEKNTGSLIATANEIIAELLVVCREHRNLADGKEEKHFQECKKINQYLKTLSAGDRVLVPELEKSLGIGPINLHLQIKKNKKFYSNNLGEYIKKKSFWKIRKFGNKIFARFKSPKQKLDR